MILLFKFETLSLGHKWLTFSAVSNIFTLNSQTNGRKIVHFRAKLKIISLKSNIAERVM